MFLFGRAVFLRWNMGGKGRSGLVLRLMYDQEFSPQLQLMG